MSMTGSFPKVDILTDPQRRRRCAVLFDELDADAKLTMVGLHPGQGAFPEGNDRLDRQPTQP